LSLESKKVQEKELGTKQHANWVDLIPFFSESSEFFYGKFLSRQVESVFVFQQEGLAPAFESNGAEVGVFREFG